MWVKSREEIIHVAASWTSAWICLFNRGTDEEGKIFHKLQYSDFLLKE